MILKKGETNKVILETVLAATVNFQLKICDSVFAITVDESCNDKHLISFDLLCDLRAGNYPYTIENNAVTIQTGNLTIQ
jgi:hypothetical protein